MIALITDRTYADITYARQLISKLKSGTPLTDEERTVYMSGLRGCYNASDVNRVGEAIVFLANILRAEGYAVDVSPRTDWGYTDIMRESDWREYLDAVRSIRAIISLPATTPVVPNTLFKADGYKAANDIERILADIEYYANAMIQNYHYCGELYLGEV